MEPSRWIYDEARDETNLGRMASLSAKCPQNLVFGKIAHFGDDDRQTSSVVSRSEDSVITLDRCLHEHRLAFKSRRLKAILLHGLDCVFKVAAQSIGNVSPGDEVNLTRNYRPVPQGLSVEEFTPEK